MIRGEEVVLITREVVGRDELNDPIYAPVESVVENVVVAPGPRDDLADGNRPEGVRVSWTCHFPKTFTGSLRGASVKVRADKARKVIGDPQPYTDANTPGPWNRPVELEGVDG